MSSITGVVWALLSGRTSSVSGSKVSSIEGVWIWMEFHRRVVDLDGVHLDPDTTFEFKKKPDATLGKTIRILHNFDLKRTNCP